MTPQQILLPIPMLLDVWKNTAKTDLPEVWERRNWHGRTEMYVCQYDGRWITSYMVKSHTFRQENPEVEKLGFSSPQEARDYCDRAATRQGYILQ